MGGVPLTPPHLKTHLERFVRASRTRRERRKTFLAFLPRIIMCWECDHTAPKCRFFEDPSWMLSTRPLPVWPPRAHVPELAPWAVKDLVASQKGKKGSESQGCQQPKQRARSRAEPLKRTLSTGANRPCAPARPARTLCDSPRLTMLHVVRSVCHGNLCSDERIAHWRSWRNTKWR